MNRGAIAGVAIASLLGCAPSASDRPLAPGVAPTSSGAPHHPPPVDSPGSSASPSASVAPARPRTTWLAAADGGASIALASSTGAILAKTGLPDGELARGLIADPLHGRALVFAFDEDDGYGELVVIPVDAASLGPAVHVAWIDGDARFASDGAILLAFEASYGDAWKRLDSAGAALPRWPAPPPLSAVSTASGLDVLTADSGGLTLAHVTLGGAWPPDVDALGSSGSTPPSARIVMSDSGEWLFDATNGQLSVRRPSPAGEPSPLGVELADGRLEQVIGFAEGICVAGLISGRDLLVTLRLDGDGVASDVVATPIGAPVTAGEAWSVEALAVVGPAELGVATALGVVAFRVDLTDGVARDPDFDGASFVAPIASWP